jgi:hypothetical protein
MRGELPWSVPVRLGEVSRGTLSLDLRADERTRAHIARLLQLVRLDRFDAEVRIRPWLDGAELNGRWTARVAQTCGVSLEDFDTQHDADFLLRVVPPSSKLAVPQSAETVVDPEAEDPPDVLEGDVIEVGGYLVEQLALELDPFPRKPGVSFEPPSEGPPLSPFAVLQALKPKDDPGPS